MSKILTQVANRDMKYNSEPDHIYVDYSIQNNKADGKPTPLIFSDLRTQKVLENPQDYYVTVCRFHIDTYSSIPAIIPQIQLGQSDPDLCVYSFTLSYETYEAQVYLNFIPQNKAEAVPKAPTNQQDMSNKYYFVNSYSYFVDLLNKTLKSAFDALAELTELPTENCPFLIYDATSGSMIFNADVSAFDINLETPIKIFCNTQMRNLLSGFEWLNFGDGATNGMNYQLNIYSNFGTNILELSTYNVISSYEEYNSIICWCPVQCIQISSSSIPIYQTIVSNPVSYNSITSMSASSNNVTAPTLTDFVVSLDNGKEYIPSVDYVASHYRLIDMFGHTPVQNIQLYVSWKDHYDNTYQLELPSGGSANLKLLFRSKKFASLFD